MSVRPTKSSDTDFVQTEISIINPLKYCLKSKENSAFFDCVFLLKSVPPPVISVMYPKKIFDQKFEKKIFVRMQSPIDLNTKPAHPSSIDLNTKASVFFSQQSYPIKSIKSATIGVSLANTKGFVNIIKLLWSQTKPIFMPPLLSRTWKLCYLTFTVFAIGHGTYMW